MLRMSLSHLNVGSSYQTCRTLEARRPTSLFENNTRICCRLSEGDNHMKKSRIDVLGRTEANNRSLDNTKCTNSSKKSMNASNVKHAEAQFTARLSPLQTSDLCEA